MVGRIDSGIDVQNGYTTDNWEDRWTANIAWVCIPILILVTWYGLTDAKQRRNECRERGGLLVEGKCLAVKELK